MKTLLNLFEVLYFQLNEQKLSENGISESDAPKTQNESSLLEKINKFLEERKIPKSKLFKQLFILNVFFEFHKVNSKTISAAFKEDRIEHSVIEWLVEFIVQFDTSRFLTDQINAFNKWYDNEAGNYKPEFLRLVHIGSVFEKWIDFQTYLLFKKHYLGADSGIRDFIVENLYDMYRHLYNTSSLFEESKSSFVSGKSTLHGSDRINASYLFSKLELNDVFTSIEGIKELSAYFLKNPIDKQWLQSLVDFTKNFDLIVFGNFQLYELELTVIDQENFKRSKFDFLNAFLLALGHPEAININDTVYENSTDDTIRQMKMRLIKKFSK